MIDNKITLKEFIREDNKFYFSKSWNSRFVGRLCKYPDYEIMKFKKYLRYSEYYFNTCNNKFKFLLAIYYQRKKNKLGYKLGIEIDINCFDKGLEIYHGAGIVVNPKARIGKNCKLHGANCLGNNGKLDIAPKIGDNVDIGFGAIIIGGVNLANDIKIGSNAVVVKNCLDSNSTLVGIPAKKVRS